MNFTDWASFDFIPTFYPITSAREMLCAIMANWFTDPCGRVLTRRRKGGLDVKQARKHVHSVSIVDMPLTFITNYSPAFMITEQSAG